MEYTNMFQMIGRENANVAIKTATDELRKAMYEENKDRAELSEKGKKLKEIFASFGPPGIKWGQVFSIILEEDLSIKDPNKIMPTIFCSCIIPVSNPNGHNYTFGEPIVIVLGSSGKESRCLRTDGTVGNMYNMGEKHSRIASDSEIDGFISEVFDEWEGRMNNKKSKKEVVEEQKAIEEEFMR
jgi:hypothetical protein